MNIISVAVMASDRVNQFLSKLGFPFNFIPKDTQDFFYNVTRQTMEMRKTDTDKVQ